MTELHIPTTGLRIINVIRTAEQGYGDKFIGWRGVHGAPAVGIPMQSNGGQLGADLIHVKAGQQFPVHTHPGDHLLYCVAGHGTMTVNEVTYEIRPGDLYMVDGAIPHAVGAITDHTILAIGAPHKPVDSPDRMTWTDWQGNPVEQPLAAGLPGGAVYNEQGQPIQFLHNEPRPCGATRQPVGPSGWECTGHDLTVVGSLRQNGVDIPMVAPTTRVDEVPASLPMRQPFTGGDHLHVVLL